MSGGDVKVADMANNLTKKLPVNRSMMTKAFESYHAKYIKPGRINPLVHAMLLVGVIGYSIEYPHIKHELDEVKIAAEKAE